MVDDVSVDTQLLPGSKVSAWNPLGGGASRSVAEAFWRGIKWVWDSCEVWLREESSDVEALNLGVRRSGLWFGCVIWIELNLCETQLAQLKN